MIFASNFLPNYDDATGAISRRLAIIPYETPILKRDLSLKTKIPKDELVTVLLRCISKYRGFLILHPDSDILELLPDVCKLESTKASISLDPLREFIENGSESYIIRKRQGNNVEWKDFVREYKAFYKDKFNKSVVIKDSDKITMTSLGFVVKETTICKECNQISNKVNCLDHFDVNNRRRKVVIENCEISRKTNMSYKVTENLGQNIPKGFYQYLAQKRNLI